MSDPNAPRAYSGDGITRFMLDTNVFDRLDEDPQVLEALARIVDRGRVEVLVALPQLDQLIAIRDEAKRQRLFAIRDRLRARQAPATQVAVPLAELGLDASSEFAADYAALQGMDVRDTADIAIATSAKWAGACFVSCDKRILKRIDHVVPSVWAMSYEEFAATILALDADARPRQDAPRSR